MPASKVYLMHLHNANHSYAPAARIRTELLVSGQRKSGAALDGKQTQGTLASDLLFKRILSKYIKMQ